MTTTTDDSAQDSPALNQRDLERLIALSGEPPTQRIDHALGLARELLGMDFAYLTEFVGDEQLVRGVSGDSASFDMSDGDGFPLEGTYCQRMIEGTIPKAVPNTAAIEELRELAVTKLSAIGAYAGVPLNTMDGKLYGTIVAVSHEPREGLGGSQVRLLELISGIIGGAIEQQRMEKENERLRARISGMTEELDAAEEDRRLSRILLSGEFRTIPHGTPPPE